MNRNRIHALFFLLTGGAMIVLAIWAMWEWLTAYEAALAYAQTVREATASQSTTPIFQDEPPYGGGFLGVVMPILFTIWGHVFISFSLNVGKTKDQ